MSKAMLKLSEVKNMEMFGDRVLLYPLGNDKFLREDLVLVNQKDKGQILKEDIRCKIINLSEEAKKQFSIGDIVVCNHFEVMIEVILANRKIIETMSVKKYKDSTADPEIEGLVAVVSSMSIISRLKKGEG